MSFQHQSSSTSFKIMRKMEDTQVCVGIRLFHDDLQISVFILTLLSAGSLILLCIFEPTCKLKGSIQWLIDLIQGKQMHVHSFIALYICNNLRRLILFDRVRRLFKQCVI